MTEQIATVLGYIVMGAAALFIVLGSICAFVTDNEFGKFYDRNLREMAELKNEVANLKRTRKG